MVESLQVHETLLFAKGFLAGLKVVAKVSGTWTVDGMVLNLVPADESCVEGCRRAAADLMAVLPMGWRMVEVRPVGWATEL